jgi:4-aminobutyrate aminotransferase
MVGLLALPALRLIIKELIMVMAEAKNKNLAYLELDEKYVNPVLSRAAKIVAERAKGSYLYDMNGDAYLDLTTGIAVNSVGHCHPRVVAAVQKQVETLIHTSVTTYNKTYIDLAQKLVEIAPDKSLDSVFLTNSGAEAVEGAIKMARYVTGRPCVINFRGSFHGRTIFTTALTTSKLYYREKYEPLPGSIYTVPYPYEYKSHFRGQPEKVMEETFAEIAVLFHQLVDPSQVACFIIEPFLGEGGYVAPPVGFLPRLRKLADEHGILLIIDEVQSGFGRTGDMFACEHEKVRPDIMLMAKAMAGGMPLAAFITSHELSKKWPSGRHGSTFGGNPVSCAAALATINVIQEDKLVERSKKLGAYMLERLKKFAEDKPHIGDVRGRGLMIGIEFIDTEGKPSKEWTEKVTARCFEDKMLILNCGSSSQVIRLIPPLTLSDEEAEKALSILEKAMTE